MASNRPKEVCKFYLQGNCRFGTRCYNIHPPKNQMGYDNRTPSNTGRMVQGWSGGGNWRGGSGGNDGGYNGGGGGNWRGGGGGGNWRGGGGGNWRGGGGGNFRSEGGGNWRGGGGDSGNWSGGGGGNWTGGGGGNNWRGGGNNWRGGGNNWRGGGSGTWNDRGNWQANQSNQGWQGNNTSVWNRRGSHTNWHNGADDWMINKLLTTGGVSNTGGGGMSGDNVFFRHVQQSMDTSDDNPTVGSDFDTVKVDISLWIQRGIWPLSSYTPSISQTTLKGFEDYSQEEVRWQAVIATSQRNSEAYLQMVVQLMEKRKLLWQQYSQLSLEEMSHLNADGNARSQSSLRPTNPQDSSSNQVGSLSKDLFNAKTMRSDNNQSTQPSNSSSGNSSVPSSSTKQLSMSQADIDAYRSNVFILGQVPETPPPPSLCH